MDALTTNLAGFLAGVACCLLGAAHGEPLAGSVVGAGLYFSQIPAFPAVERTVWVPAAAGAAGWLLESFLAACGWLAFPPGQAAFGAPLWSFFLWAQFGLVACIAAPGPWGERAWFGAGLFGLIAAPATILLGSRWGAYGESGAPLAVAFLAAIVWGPASAAMAEFVRQAAAAESEAADGAPRAGVE